MEKNKCFLLGKIVKKHSFKGEVVAKLDTDQPQIIQEVESVLIEKSNKLVPFFIKKIIMKPNGAVRIKFENVDTEQQANGILRCNLYLPETLFPKLEKKQFYYHEIYNFKVIDKIKGEIGILSAVLESDTQDLLQIESQEKEILIPLHNDFIEKIDKKNQVLYVKTPEGLIDLYLN